MVQEVDSSVFFGQFPGSRVLEGMAERGKLPKLMVRRQILTETAWNRPS